MLGSKTIRIKSTCYGCCYVNCFFVNILVGRLEIKEISEILIGPLFYKMKQVDKFGWLEFLPLKTLTTFK